MYLLLSDRIKIIIKNSLHFLRSHTLAQLFSSFPLYVILPYQTFFFYSKEEFKNKLFKKPGTKRASLGCAVRRLKISWAKWGIRPAIYVSSVYIAYYVGETAWHRHLTDARTWHALTWISDSVFFSICLYKNIHNFFALHVWITELIPLSIWRTIFLHLKTKISVWV